MEFRRIAVTLLGVFLLSIGSLGIAGAQTPPPAATPTVQPGPTATPCPGGTAVNFFTTTANGSQEVPPRESQATGTGTFTLDPATNKLTVNFTIQGSLTTTETGAHLHRGAPGVNGPVVVPLPVGSTKSVIVDFPADDVANLRAGLFYINVHTTQFPAGEIRGQLVGQCPGTPVPGTPVPATPPASTPTSVATTAPTQPPAPPAPTSTLPPFPTEVLPTQEPPTTEPPITPGMPRTGGDSNSFFYLLLALTGLALMGVGLMSRRPARR